MHPKASALKNVAKLSLASSDCCILSAQVATPSSTPVNVWPTVLCMLCDRPDLTEVIDQIFRLFLLGSSFAQETTRLAKVSATEDRWAGSWSEASLAMRLSMS